uniref:D-isomer specific 2-hydroxyacid dehydrogenase NAD-binding domain-containing protein n=1 Tax=Astatotilapia calliptera TaxID=8154 RepID=A0AAX7TPZ2_ASTCA
MKKRKKTEKTPTSICLDLLQHNCNPKICWAASGNNVIRLQKSNLITSRKMFLIGHQIAVDPNTTSIPQNPMGVEVTGSTLGIIGMGHIGYRIARRSKGFDMKILYHNRNRSSQWGASYCENMDDLLREADFVVLVVNLSPETKGLISHRELSLMKPTATLVNVSLVVDQDALVKALQSGEIRAAALDVTHPEPLPRTVFHFASVQFKLDLAQRRHYFN